MVLLRADVGTLEQTERAIGDLGRVVQRTFRDADMAGRVDGTDCGVLNVRVGVAHFDPGRPCSFEELVAEADAGMQGTRRQPTHGTPSV